MTRHAIYIMALAAALAGCARAPEDSTVTFVVMGDNRGGNASGSQPSAFHDLVREVSAMNNIALVWNTGDMIFGRTNDMALVRAQWQQYQEAIRTITVPVYHVPGNHDVWDAASRALYESLWGPLYFLTDRGPFRFIALDTESDTGRIGGNQMAWLRETLAAAGDRRVFVFLHRPLFPVASHLETSLDAYPQERDALHELFVQHRDRIAAVFAGHEHLFHHQTRDGIAYYTTGGGGADLHAPPELGGFHHYLVVRATSNDAAVTVRRPGRAETPTAPARRLEPGDLIESWETGRLWYTWDYSVSAARTTALASEGAAALAVNVDLQRCGWPVLYSPTPGASDLAAWSLDVFLPYDAPDGFVVTPAVSGRAKHEPPSIRLTGGWNRVRTEISTDWFPASARAGAEHLEWTIHHPDRRWRGDILFDRFTINDVIHEDWERPLVWNAWGESVRGAFITNGVTEGRRALLLEFGADEKLPPMLVGKAHPPLNASTISWIEVSVHAPDDPPTLTLVIGSDDRNYPAPPVPLQPGSNVVRVTLAPSWLPAAARARIKQLSWRITPVLSAKASSLIFDELRAGGGAREP